LKWCSKSTRTVGNSWLKLKLQTCSCLKRGITVVEKGVSPVQSTNPEAPVSQISIFSKVTILQAVKFYWVIKWTALQYIEWCDVISTQYKTHVKHSNLDCRLAEIIFKRNVTYVNCCGYQLIHCFYCISGNVSLKVFRFIYFCLFKANDSSFITFISRITQ
jgi:hypothetical protein